MIYGYEIEWKVMVDFGRFLKFILIKNGYFKLKWVVLKWIKYG